MSEQTTPTSTLTDHQREAWTNTLRLTRIFTLATSDPGFRREDLQRWGEEAERAIYRLMFVSGLTFDTDGQATRAVR